MISPQSFRNKINEFINSLPNKDRFSFSKSSTIRRLITLTTYKNFDENANREIDFFSKKYDISSKLFASYDEIGRKSSDELLSLEGLQIFVSLLYLRVLISSDQVTSEIHRAKYINICLKAFEHISLPGFLKIELDQLKQLQDELFNHLPVKKLHEKTLSHHIIKDTPKVNWKGFKTLPIDILFYEGPIARAYLEMLCSIRCKPRRIIHLIAKRDIVTKKKVGIFLPSFLRYRYAAIVQSRKIHHWPQYLFRTQKKLCLEIFKQVQQTLKIEESTLLGLIKLKPLNNYSDNIVTFPIDYYNDPELLSFIKKQNVSMYLFTGGGIISKDFLNIKKTQFIHIHPGYLPDIRGADCLLWSAMLTGYPSATCFFMDSGIDSGDIINRLFLPQIKLPRASDLDKKMSYRLLYSFIDPWVRSVALRDTLRSTNYLENITAYSQKLEEGNTFHFMQEKMISKVINNFF